MCHELLMHHMIRKLMKRGLIRAISTRNTCASHMIQKLMEHGLIRAISTRKSMKHALIRANKTQERLVMIHWYSFVFEFQITSITIRNEKVCFYSYLKLKTVRQWGFRQRTILSSINPSAQNSFALQLMSTLKGAHHKVDILKTKRIWLVKVFISENYAGHFHSTLIEIIAAFCEENKCVWRLCGTTLQHFLNANTKRLQWDNTMDFRDIKNDIHLVFELYLFGRKNDNQEIILCWRLQQSNPRAFLVINYRLKCEELGVDFESKSILNTLYDEEMAFNKCHGCSHMRKTQSPNSTQITHLTFSLEIIHVTKVEKYWQKYPNRLSLVNKDSYQIHHLNGNIYLVFQ
eukprot:48329_1